MTKQNAHLPIPAEYSSSDEAISNFILPDLQEPPLQGTEELFSISPETLAGSVHTTKPLDVEPASEPYYTIPPVLNAQHKYLYALCLSSLNKRLSEIN